MEAPAHLHAMSLDSWGGRTADVIPSPVSWTLEQHAGKSSKVDPRLGQIVDASGTVSIKVQLLASGKHGTTARKRQPKMALSASLDNNQLAYYII